MVFDYNADEILEIAEHIERNGANFYRNAAEKIDDENKKKLLLNLAEMEDEHELIFKKMREELSDDDKLMTRFDPEDETAKYLKALADTRVFYEREIDRSSLKEIFEYAISSEKESIVFYLGMKNVVPASLGKNKIDSIIKEEMNHIVVLTKELLSI